jgi:hypothetical protein
LAFIAVLTDWFARAFDTFLWPFLGFLLMPYTTLAYLAGMLNNDRHISGFWAFLLILAVIADLGGQGETARQKATKPQGTQGA